MGIMAPPPMIKSFGKASFFCRPCPAHCVNGHACHGKPHQHRPGRHLPKQARNLFGSTSGRIESRLRSLATEAPGRRWHPRWDSGQDS